MITLANVDMLNPRHYLQLKMTRDSQDMLSTDDHLSRFGSDPCIPHYCSYLQSPRIMLLWQVDTIDPWTIHLLHSQLLK